MTRALVVFRDSDNRGILRFLKPGFRHCFILVEHEAGWCFLENTFLGFHWDVLPHNEVGQIIQWYQAQNMTVVNVALGSSGQQKICPPGVFSCVELVKRVLGIHAFWVQTPWSLYRHLKLINKLGKKSLTQTC